MKVPERSFAFFLGTLRKLFLWRGVILPDELPRYDLAICKLVDRQNWLNRQRLELALWGQSKSYSGRDNTKIK